MKWVVFMLSLLLLGIIIIALPDSDVRLFSFSKDHGPSLQDLTGLVVILIPYLWFVWNSWKRRDRVLEYKHSVFFQLGIFFSGTGLGLVIASVRNDYPYWWFYGIGVIIVVQSIVFYIALKRLK